MTTKDITGWGMVGAAVGMLGYLFGRRLSEVPLAEAHSVWLYEEFAQHLRYIHTGEFKRARRALVAAEAHFDKRIMPLIVGHLPEAFVAHRPELGGWREAEGHDVATSPEKVLEYAQAALQEASRALKHLDKWPDIAPEGEYASTSLELLIKTLERSVDPARHVPALRPGPR